MSDGIQQSPKLNVFAVNDGSYQASFHACAKEADLIAHFFDSTGELAGTLKVSKNTCETELFKTSDETGYVYSLVSIGPEKYFVYPDKYIAPMVFKDPVVTAVTITLVTTLLINLIFKTVLPILEYRQQALKNYRALLEESNKKSSDMDFSVVIPQDIAEIAAGVNKTILWDKKLRRNIENLVKLLVMRTNRAETEAHDIMDFKLKLENFN